MTSRSRSGSRRHRRPASTVSVWPTSLRSWGERFALVDPEGGAGYNAAARAMCRRAGFEPRTSSAPSGPMAWESAVRNDGCVGLTTRASAASTLRGVAVVALADAPTFALDLLWPDGAGVDGPAAAFAATARDVAESHAQRGARSTNGV